jgi:hypothetical protein
MPPHQGYAQSSVLKDVSVPMECFEMQEMSVFLLKSVQQGLELLRNVQKDKFSRDVVQLVH